MFNVGNNESTSVVANRDGYTHSSTALSFPEKKIAGLSIFKNPDPASIKKLLNDYQIDSERLTSSYEVLNSSDVKFSLYYLQSVPGSWGCRSMSSLNSALQGLSADYWAKALALTDVLDHMDADTRLEWTANVADWTVPLFETEVVVSTIIDLLNKRDKFLAEKVDGIFKKLSKVHVTNDPAGFTQRFIMNGIIGSSSKKEAIDDLRQIIASFMNRPVTKMRHMYTGTIIENAWKHNSGQWLELDGGAIKFKVFKKQTIHFEIHPDLAWRLNEILSVIYPHAIPEEFKSRKSKGKPIKEFDLKQKLIEYQVLSDLVSLEGTRIWDFSGYEARVVGTKENSVSPRYRIDCKDRVKKLDAFLCACGGVRSRSDKQEWNFDYDFLSIRDDIVRNGEAPDFISHQYFPTEDFLSTEVIERLDIQPSDSLLEPSAGQGNIAAKMKGQGKSVTCVEVSALNGLVLQAIGFDNVIVEDFIKFASTAPKFDKIGMNPPFSQGRAQLHVETAMSLLKQSGSKLVAIVPPTLKNKLNVEGFDAVWSENFYNQFTHTNVTVCIVEITKL